MLLDIDEAALYEISELYRFKYSADDVMPDTTIEYFKKLYSLGIKYFGRHDLMSWELIYKSMLFVDPKLNQFIEQFNLII